MKPLAKPVEELPREQLPHHEDPRCVPVRRLLQTVGSKWCSLVVAHLEYEPRRFSDLKRSIGGVTQKSLTATLRELEKDGLVNRVVTPSIPPRVDYSLTPLGRTLLVPRSRTKPLSPRLENGSSGRTVRTDLRGCNPLCPHAIWRRRRGRLPDPRKAKAP